MPPLPALVLTHLPSGDEIYQYPPNTPIVAPSVLQWLQRIEDGTETPAGNEEEVKEIKAYLGKYSAVKKQISSIFAERRQHDSK